MTLSLLLSICSSAASGVFCFLLKLALDDRDRRINNLEIDSKNLQSRLNEAQSTIRVIENQTATQIKSLEKLSDKLDDL